jgi:phenylalanine-4-hydroxylase
VNDPRPKQKHLVELDRDHPGFRDPDYRRRRDEIARVAHEYRDGEPVPRVVYTGEEHGVWREVWRQLAPLHDELACRSYLDASARLSLDREAVPQLADVNVPLLATTGFSMTPVAGLVDPRTFLEYLGRDVFLSTQYMRHFSRPLYTPEPDVVHELIGHAATLLDPGFVALNRAFGEAVRDADPNREQALIGVYWWTIEFGVLYEGGALKAYGAGLLSSFGELGGIRAHADVRPLDLDEAAATPFDPTDYQRVLFVARSFDSMAADVTAWLSRTGRPRAAAS